MPSSEISMMPKTIPHKQATATPAGTQDAATPATLQASATPAATESPQPIPGTSRNAAFPNPYEKPPPTTLEETKARFQIAALSFTKVESNIHGMGNLLTFWTPTLSSETEMHRQVLISSLRDVKCLAKFARDHFNFDELEVSLETKIKDMRIIYEIVENYISRKPAQTSTPQTQQQPPAPSRQTPTLPPKTAFQASPSPSNVSNQQFATGNPESQYCKETGLPARFHEFHKYPWPNANWC